MCAVEDRSSLGVGASKIGSGRLRKPAALKLGGQSEKTRWVDRQVGWEGGGAVSRSRGTFGLSLTTHYALRHQPSPGQRRAWSEAKRSTVLVDSYGAKPSTEPPARQSVMEGLHPSCSLDVCEVEGCKESAARTGRMCVPTSRGALGGQGPGEQEAAVAR